MSLTPPPLPAQGLLDNQSTAPTLISYASEPGGQCALYSPQAVGVATLLGAPIAGTMIMAINYRRIGRPRSAIIAVVCGAVVTAALIGIAFALPAGTSGTMIGLASLFIMVQIAKGQQGAIFERHKQSGGKVASAWKAAGVGLVSLVVLCSVIFTIAFAVISANTPIRGTRFAVGNCEIFYSGAATSTEAAALGKSLTDIGYFTPARSISVLLTKDSSGTTLRYVVNEAAAQKDETLANFTVITESVAPSVGGKPITFKLVNPQLQVIKSKMIP